MKHPDPMVKKNTSYSILFLRDDSSVVRFRLKPFWIKFFAIVFVVFSATSGASGYAAHYYWKRYNTIKQKNADLDLKLEENSRKLAAFSGVEVVRESSTLPRSSMAGVTTLAGNGKPNGAQDSSTGATQTPDGATSANTSSSAPDAPAGASEQGNNDAAPPADTQPDTGSGSPGSDAQPPQLVPVTPDGQPGAGTEPAEREHPALVSEVVVRPEGEKRFSLTFDLSNRNKDLTLNGRVLVQVAAKDGKRHEITAINRNTLRFIINNYKRVNTSFTLPPDIEAEDVTRLFLIVTPVRQENQQDGSTWPEVTYSFAIPPAS